MISKNGNDDEGDDGKDEKKEETTRGLKALLY